MTYEEFVIKYKVTGVDKASRDISTLKNELNASEVPVQNNTKAIRDMERTMGRLTNTTRLGLFRNLFPDLTLKIQQSEKEIMKLQELMDLNEVKMKWNKEDIGLLNEQGTQKQAEIVQKYWDDFRKQAQNSKLSTMDMDFTATLALPKEARGKTKQIFEGMRSEMSGRMESLLSSRVEWQRRFEDLYSRQGITAAQFLEMKGFKESIKNADVEIKQLKTDLGAVNTVIAAFEAVDELPESLKRIDPELYKMYQGINRNSKRLEDENDQLKKQKKQLEENANAYKRMQEVNNFNAPLIRTFKIAVAATIALIAGTIKQTSRAIKEWTQSFKQAMQYGNDFTATQVQSLKYLQETVGLSTEQISQLMSQNNDEFKELLQNYYNLNNTTDEQAKKLSGVSTEIGNLKTAWNAFWTDVADVMAPVIEGPIKTLTGWLSWASNNGSEVKIVTDKDVKNLEDAAAAAGLLKRQVMGFDELNRLQSNLMSENQKKNIMEINGINNVAHYSTKALQEVHQEVKAIQKDGEDTLKVFQKNAKLIGSINNGGNKPITIFSPNNRVKMSKMAEGGVVRKPTVSLVGEYSNAMNNPEIISPQNVLEQTINKANGNLAGVYAQVASQIITAIENKNMTVSIDDNSIARSAARGQNNYRRVTGKGVILI